MRTIEWTGQFKRDYKRELKGPHRRAVEGEMFALLEQLAADQPLSEKYRDHGLSGVWKSFRDCHIKPDLVLIYQREGAETLRLIRLGSHSELGI